MGLPPQPRSLPRQARLAQQLGTERDKCLLRVWGISEWIIADKG